MMILRCNLWFKLREIKSDEIGDVKLSITDILYIEKQETMQNKRKITG